jgi:3-isopropylmalate dehydrogenase
MLRISFGLADEAAAIEQAVTKVLAEGYRTGDIVQSRSAESKEILVGTRLMTEMVIAALQA